MKRHVDMSGKETGAEEIKLLIVDDRPENLVAMRAALDDLGVGIMTAESGEKALSLLLRHRFAVVLLDVQMPKLDGFETAALMRGYDETRNIPIIFVTAINKHEDYVFRGYESGAVDYLFKPVDPRILRSKVQVFLDLHRSHAELERTVGELEQANACLDDFAFALRGLMGAARTCDAPVPVMLDPEEMVGRAHALLGQLAVVSQHRRGPVTQVHFLDKSYPVKGVRGPVMEALVASLEDVAKLGRQVVHTYDKLKDEVEERRRAEQAALEANDARGRFLRHMSHEFRTPLNAIIGFGELLRLAAGKQGLDDDFREGLASIERAGQYLLALVNEILEFASLETGNVSIDSEEISIYETVHEIYCMIMPLARKNKNRLLLDCEDDIGVMMTDRLKLYQILNNLLGNACKFTSGGEVSIRVSRERGSHGDEVIFRVADTGIGIDVRDQGMIFEEFKQADQSPARKHSGAGLGLTITKRYCRMLRGSINVDSTPGKGSTFIVRLPAHSDESTAERAAGAGPEPTA